MVNEVHQVLRVVSSLPVSVQRDIAKRSMASIAEAAGRIKSAGTNVDEVTKELIRDATSARQFIAYQLGATGIGDPNWATAALVESWVTAMSPRLDRKVFIEVNDLILVWAKSALSTRNSSRGSRNRRPQYT
jgi:hypothetical protein